MRPGWLGRNGRRQFSALVPDLFPTVTPNSMLSQAKRRHVAARRNGGGAFTHAQDAAIAWQTVTDYGDIALVEDPAHDARQAHPAIVATNADSDHGVAWGTAIGAADLGTIATTPRENTSDPASDKRRIARVLIPGQASKHAWLQRFKPMDFTSAVCRAEIRQMNSNYTGVFLGSDTFLADMMPRGVELWWGVAQLLDPFSEETWGPWTGGEVLFGHQIHADNRCVINSPQEGTYISGGGNENQHKWFLRTRGPTVVGTNSADTNNCPLTLDKLWERTGLPMGVWQFFIHRRVLHWLPSIAQTQMWYSQGSDAYSATPAPVVDCSAAAGAVNFQGTPIANYANDPGCGPTQAHKLATGYTGNYGVLDDNVRVDSENYAGDPWLSMSAMYAYSPTGVPFDMTILSVPLPWHERANWRARDQYAGDLLLLLRRSVGLA